MTVEMTKEEKIKGAEKIETITPETIDVPDYQYGNWQDTLDAEIALRNNNSSWWSSIKIWTFTLTSTWSKVITWVWFTPKRVKLIAWDNSWNPSYVSIWTMNNNWEQYSLNMQTSAIDSTRCIHMWTKAWAVYVSMDSDWFTINCNYWTNTAYVTYECFW